MRQRWVDKVVPKTSHAGGDRWGGKMRGPLCAWDFHGLARWIVRWVRHRALSPRRTSDCDRRCSYPQTNPSLRPAMGWSTRALVCRAAPRFGSWWDTLGMGMVPPPVPSSLQQRVATPIERQKCMEIHASNCATTQAHTPKPGGGLAIKRCPTTHQPVNA